jgi:radical S-adenosyl methionine domain-containing protein 2
MRCKFCFATFQDVKKNFLPAGHLPEEQAIEVVRHLAEIGFEKITFAGGEPTLCPWLPKLIATAKEFGLTTMIVSNGIKIDNEFLETNKNTLDWIAISIDSLNPESNIEMGRAIIGKKPLSVAYYTDLVNRIKAYGYGLKLNTVVNRKNYNENLTDFIQYAKPQRWKILQVLPIIGQNDHKIDDFIITDVEFQVFLKNHSDLNDITTMVPETNSQILGSYAMVDPAGRFFDDLTGTHSYSKPILEVGVEQALQQVSFDFNKFLGRGGKYNWSKNS